jgi:hypothetical protein
MSATFTETFKKAEWMRFLKANSVEYRVGCLRAVLRNDGPAMLEKCLHDLGWTRTIDLITEVEEKSK